MHTALNILDAEQANYRALNARLATAPLPHLEIANRRAQRDRRVHIPHIDAAAHARAERNARLAAWDGVLAGAAVIAGTALFSAVVAAAAFVIGGVL
ncbi:hypothetical protein [Methylobacterium aquaticum]|uniref:Uncharacterized protein n=1 Tax=Methylobacterium aquaticum TaxID=270351 RepID=A0A0C6FM55_9HYPH|nr:hypothetical protein [Methylobacterium aquaticum]BAQ49473.1 hypothetical protein Maq22A_1p36325 [Methylobacterium aquaticum]